MTPTRGHARSEVVILLATAGAHRLVLRADEVAAVTELAEVPERPLSVPRALGLAVEPGVRAVQLGSGRWLDLGPHLELRTIAARAFAPLPLWLPARCHALPLTGAVELREGFGFELDAALLEIAPTGELAEAGP